MDGGLLGNVVVAESAGLIELLASENEALLVGRDALLVLDLLLEGLDGVSRLDLDGHGLSGEGPDEDLHSTAESQDQVDGGLLLDVVVAQGARLVELLAREDQALLVVGDALLVLDLLLQRLDRVHVLHFDGHRLSAESFNENLHALLWF